VKILSLRTRRNDQGQSLIEFAFVLPIVIVLVFGVIYVSALFYSYMTLQSAVREGASTIVRDGRNQTVQSITTLVQSNAFALSNVTVQITPSDPALWTTPRIRITVEAWFTVPFPQLAIPLLGNATARMGSLRIYAQSNMTTE